MIRSVMKEISVVTPVQHFITSDGTTFLNYKDALLHEIPYLLGKEFLRLSEDNFDNHIQYISYLEEHLMKLENKKLKD